MRTNRQCISRAARTRRLKRQAISLIIVIVVITPLLNAARARAADAPIRLNTVGFLPHHDKRASVAAACTEFSVVSEADGKTVFHGKTSGPVRNPDTGEDLYLADFSAL